MKRYPLTIGDWSHDGHGWTQSFTVTVDSESDDDIQRAWKNGLSMIPAEIHPENICCDYQEGYISRDQARLIEQYLSFDLQTDDTCYVDAVEQVYMSPECMAEIVARVITLGGVTASIDEQPTDLVHVLGSGHIGYGLFSC